jgi:hypothetical protein
MSVALVVITDGRWQYLNEMFRSAREWLTYPFAHVRVVDDSGGSGVGGWPSEFEVVRHPLRRGLAAAVQSAWADLPADIDYVFHVEEDFVFVEPVDIDGMAMVLKEHGRLAQLVLKRQPWSPEETAAGGIIESHPDEYRQRDGWVEHTRIFSLNPCLIPRVVVDMGWPAGNEAEMTARLVADGWSFGFWGRRDDPPRVFHIGARRSAGWML